MLQRGGQILAGGGVLAPLWPVIADTGEINKAYPDRLLSIEEYTKGRINTGDIITADNVKHVKDLLEPAKYKHVKEMGRRLKILPTTTDYMRLGPWEYLEATLRNQGKARFDERQNVVTQNGKPWIGGDPFPNADTALKLFAGLTLSWGRHDSSVYAVKEKDIAHNGETDYEYNAVWVELAPVARTTVEPKPYMPEHRDKLRFNSVIFTSPDSHKGTSFLNIWPYDQHQFPELYGYLPEFRRIRQFPTNQRFEPLVPGSALYLSDAWAAGDPLHTWGNYRIIGRQPMLAGVSGGWNGRHPNWEHGLHGGPEGQSFFDSVVELVPEAIITEAEPVAYKRAPVSKKRVWFDARNHMPIAMVTYDRKGEPFRSFDGCYSLYDDGENRFMDGKHPYWSWTYVHAYDFQTGRITRLEQVREISGEHKTLVNDPSIYKRYLTRNAISSMGRV
ncbi:DUF1329 domain-containing protein [Spectribacter hydrogenooxidans]|uniref:DUF1329 domain-containing protein n=1 Tax=Spectribacter hydrogenoxidans TaxID=3075608 RepID=A0ABU3C475_9GAMM|nr:DUF1329 domain-containing protein [Salinisphaera sp. W335]MDT0636342.1 DUF1329 domain-containing protein [Salinisphaera sp. W335]